MWHIYLFINKGSTSKQTAAYYSIYVSVYLVVCLSVCLLYYLNINTYLGVAT